MSGSSSSSLPAGLTSATTPAVLTAANVDSTVTPSATPGPPSPPPTPQPAPETNAGAIAGAAVGCLVAGLLLGFAIAFFLFQRKSKKQRRRDSERAFARERKTSSSSVAARPASAEPKLQVAKFLLESSPDSEIASELHSLDALILQHVENNYHLGPVQADSRALAMSLRQLGVGDKNGGGLAAETIAQLALDPATCHVALRHVISQVLFRSIDVSASSELSMLPAPVAAFLRSIPPQRESGERDIKVCSLALNQWRTLSAFLLHPLRSERTPLPISKAAVDPQAAALAHAMDAFLGYFTEHHSQQRDHLEAVVVEVAKFGYELLSQPSEWRFDFVHAGLKQQSGGALVAVVCPGLVKVADKEGRAYPVPQEIVAPSTVLI